MRSVNRVLRQFNCQSNFLKHVSRRNLSDTVDHNSIPDPKTFSNKSDVEQLLNDSALGSDPLDEATIDDSWNTSPYPEGVVLANDNLKTLKPNVDPRETSIIFFPGYGSQYVGMGRDLAKYPAARDIIDAACDILEYDAFKLMQKGPQNKLNDIRFADPLIFISSLAALQKLKEERPWTIENCVATAGYDVGEITALTFAGVFTFSDGLKLVRTRANALHIASEHVNGGMALIHNPPQSQLKTALLRAREWCSERGISNPVCQIAGYLSYDLRIISGHNEALKYIECNQKYFKLERMSRLPVKAAYNSRLMVPAIYRIREKLKEFTLKEPLLCVHSNFSGNYYDNVVQIDRTIPKSVSNPVKWEHMLNNLYKNAPATVQPETVICGPTNKLGEYVKRRNREAAKLIHEALGFMEEKSSRYKYDFKKRLVAPGPLHTSLMRPIRKVMKNILADIQLHEPSTHIYTGFDYRRYGYLDRVKNVLPRTVDNPILWQHLIVKLLTRTKGTNFPTVVVCGPQADNLLAGIHSINRAAVRNAIIMH